MVNISALFRHLCGVTKKKKNDNRDGSKGEWNQVSLVYDTILLRTT
jgi:hypothetical protein